MTAIFQHPARALSGTKSRRFTCGPLSDKDYQRLLRFPLWERTAQSQANLRKVLDEDAMVHVYRRGDLICQEGDYGDSAMVVLVGAVQIVTEKPGEGLSAEERGSRSAPQRSVLERIQQRFWQLIQARPDREVRDPEEIKRSSRLADLAEHESRTPILLQDIPLVLDRHRTVRLGPGELFGELSAIGHMPRTASVFAVEEQTRLLLIRWPGLRKLRHPDLRDQIPGSGDGAANPFDKMLDEVYRARALRVQLRSTPAFARVGQTAAIEDCLARGEFVPLFCKEIGDSWRPLEGAEAEAETVRIDDNHFTLQPLAQGQAGTGWIKLWRHDGPIPPAEVRSRLEQHVWCRQPENIVVYRDPGGAQLWQWLVLEPEAQRVPHEFRLEPRMRFEGLVEGFLSPDPLAPEAPDLAQFAAGGDAKALLLAAGAQQTKAKRLQVEIEGQTYKLAPLVELASCTAFGCKPDCWPDRACRALIESRVQHLGHPLLVFETDRVQLWRCRGAELAFDPAQPPVERLGRFLHSAPLASPSAWDQARRALESFELVTLLRDHLGWSATSRGQRDLSTAAGAFQLVPLAEREGRIAFQCVGAHADTPEDAESRAELERAAGDRGDSSPLLIFTDPERKTQLWRHAGAEYLLALSLPAHELLHDFLLRGQILDRADEAGSLISAIQRVDLDYMFVARLGWKISDAPSVTIEGHRLDPIARQGEMVVYHCHPDSGGALPEAQIRDEIDQQIAGAARTRLIVFSGGDAARQQIWRARRTTYREQAYTPGESPAELIRNLIRPLIHDELCREANAILTAHGDYDRWRSETRPIIEQGAPAESLVSVCHGFARLVRQEEGQERRTLSYLGRGGVYGTTEMLRSWSSGTPATWDCSLYPQGHVNVLEIPQAVLARYVLPTLLPEAVAAQDPIAPASRIGPEMLGFLVDQRVIHGRAAMLIDLERCTRCDDCVVACAETHQGNPRFVRHGPRQGRYLFASACLHCGDPLCMSQCPTAAIHRDLVSGEVQINDAVCIGCQRCAKDCPYDDIQMVPIRDSAGVPFLQQRDQPVLKAVKCDLCHDQLSGPACQQACAHDALIRADLNLTELGPLARWLHR